MLPSTPAAVEVLVRGQGVALEGPCAHTTSDGSGVGRASSAFVRMATGRDSLMEKVWEGGSEFLARPTLACLATAGGPCS